jgi:hypothetical protein
LEREPKEAQAANKNGLEKPPVAAEARKAKEEALAYVLGVVAIQYNEAPKCTDDGWPKVWTEISDEELRERLRHYLLLAADGPNQHVRCICATLG